MPTVFRCIYFTKSAKEKENSNCPNINSLAVNGRSHRETILDPWLQRLRYGYNKCAEIGPRSSAVGGHGHLSQSCDAVFERGMGTEK